MVHEAKKLLGGTRQAQQDHNILEMQVALGRVCDKLPAFWRKHVGLTSGTEGLAPSSWSDTEFVRKNLSKREISISHLEQRTLFPPDILTAEQRATAVELLEMKDFASDASWPLPGDERPRLGPY